MSNDVVISKELRDKLMSLAWEAGSVQLQNQLRTAPETVSLEGVDEFMASRQFHTMGDYELLEQHTAQDFVDLIYLVSDLHRLVAPVHGGGGDTRTLENIKTAIKVILHHPEAVDYIRAYAEQALSDLAHLTTTQSAPSVASRSIDLRSISANIATDTVDRAGGQSAPMPSFPTVEEIQSVILKHGDAIGSLTLAEHIFALIISRTEGK